MKRIVKSPLVLVVGSGPGISHSVGKVFYKAGYSVVLARRSQDKVNEDVASLKKSIEKISEDQSIDGYSCDCSKEDQVVALFNSIDKDRLKVVVYNAGGFAMGSILDAKIEDFQRTWENSTLGGFIVGREAARVFDKHLQDNKEGSDTRTIIYTGASASLRGKAKFAAFGSAKAGLRSLSQSLARELGPRGIHVAHVVVDGPVDSIEKNIAAKDPSKNVIDPDGVAESYLSLSLQTRRAFTHELDIRTSIENW